jgi:glycosyltransferase involved in cell wall biosynthesis
VTGYNQPLVSVIVASYNHVSFLDDRMKSLLNQTYSNIEVIVIDDNSTDESALTLRKYLKDSRVKLIENTTNTGWVNVSNQGFLLSEGEYVVFANCDDTCESTLIENLVQFFQLNPSAGIVFCRSSLIDSEGMILGEDFAGREFSFRKLCDQDILISPQQMQKFLIHSCVIPNLSAAMIKSHVFKELKGFTREYKICSDWDLYFRLSKVHSFGYVSRSLNRFRQHKNTVRSTQGEIKVLEEVLALLLEKNRLLEVSFLKRFSFRYSAARIFCEWYVRRYPPNLKNLGKMTKRLAQIDLKVLGFLPIALMIRIYRILIRD